MKKKYTGILNNRKNLLYKIKGKIVWYRHTTTGTESYDCLSISAMAKSLSDAFCAALPLTSSRY